MKGNKNDNYLIDKLDNSYQSYKYQYKKNSKNKTNIISKNIYSTNKNINTHNYATYKNLNRNKSNINKPAKKSKEPNYINNNNRINLLHISKNQINYNKITKNKFQNSPKRRDCHTPDKNLNNLKYNISLTNKKDMKNNIILLKSNMQRNTSFIEYHFKNNPKRFLTRSKSKYNIYNNISDDRKKVLTPDRMKTRNIKLSKNPINLNKYGENKKIKEPYNNFNLSQNYIYPNFSNSYNYYNLNNSNNSIKNYGKSNYFFSNNHIMKNIEKSKTPDRYQKNNKYNNYNEKKFNTRLLKPDKLPILTNASKDKLSKSFCSRDNSNDRENKYFLGNKNRNILTNIKLNKNKKEFNKLNIQNYYSKAINRTKSTDIMLNQRINSNNKIASKNNISNNSHLKHNSKNRNNNFLINNISYENINNKSNNTHHNLFNNQLMDTNNTTFNFSQKNNNLLFFNKENFINNKLKNNENNNSFSKKKTEKNNNNINTSTFLEIAQQKINYKNNISKIKNSKYNGTNNFITKSSTNTNDDVNSSNSLNSRNNIILDSIEELHFNFVNIELSSRNLMKTQENLEGEKIINNNPNSTVIMVEERDIE